VRKDLAAGWVGGEEREEKNVEKTPQEPQFEGALSKKRFLGRQPSQTYKGGKVQGRKSVGN